MEARTDRPGASSVRSAPDEAVAALPPELVRFLAVMRHPWIMVRGPAGSGKAMLAARLLGRVPGPGVWVNTRPSSRRGSLAVPIGGATGASPVRAVDLTDPQSDPSDWPAPETVQRIHAGGIDDEAETSWLPTPLDAAWENLRERGDGGLVIDSWDGLLDQYVERAPEVAPTRDALERGLLQRLGAAQGLMVLICDPDGGTRLEQMADAILQTAVGEIEERSIRVMTIPKLRGVALDETVFPYTLDGGVFRHLPRSLLDLHRIGNGSDPDPSPDPRSLWPGSADLAAAFGRWATGRASLLEREEAVPGEILLSVSVAAAIGTLRRGGRVLQMPPLGVAPERLYAIYRQAIPPEDLARRLRVITLPFPDEMPAEARSIVLPLATPGHENIPMMPYGDAPEEESIEPVAPGVTEFVASANDDPHPALVLADVPGFLHAVTGLGRTPTPQFLANSLRRLVEHRAVHVLGTGVVEERVLDPLRNLARPQVRLVARRGRVFALGTHPWTPAYVVLPPAQRGEGAPFSLVRVS